MCAESLLRHGLHLLASNVRLHVFEAQEPGPRLSFKRAFTAMRLPVCTHSRDARRGLRAKRGKLLICPVMNPGAYRARQRRAHVRGAYEGLDLIAASLRCECSALESRLAAYFMNSSSPSALPLFARCTRAPAVQQEVVPSFGQTLVYGVEPMLR